MFGKASINTFKESIFLKGECHNLMSQSNTKEVTFVIDGVQNLYHSFYLFKEYPKMYSRIAFNILKQNFDGRATYERDNIITESFNERDIGNVNNSCRNVYKFVTDKLTGQVQLI